MCFAPTGCGDSFQDIERDEDSGVPAPLADGGGGSTTDAGPNADADVDAASTAKFTLSVGPELYIAPGEQNITLAVSITRAEGFDDPVTISVNGLPSAVHVGPLTLTDNATGTLVFGADPSALIGGATITVLGIAGRLSASASLSLFIAGQWEFDANGAFVVPQVVPPTLDFYLWGGGGGGGGTSGNQNPTNGGHGGAGGAALGRVPVTPAEALTIQVGGGGQVKHSSSGSGGGYTALLRDTTPLLLAGGGGGGGYGYGISSTILGTDGGAGGGEAGGGAEGGAQGGTATAGGLGAGTHAMKDGTALLGGLGLGGTGVNSVPGALPGGGAASSGGGGGGGFFGGGGGKPYSGGGGGSGFAADSVLAIGESPRLLTGIGKTPPLTSSVYYAAGVGIGGTRSDAPGTSFGSDPTPGGNGRVVVVLAKP